MSSRRVLARSTARATPGTSRSRPQTARAASSRPDSGNVEVAVPAGEYAVDTDTDSGNVEVDERISRNDRAVHSIDAKTDSGNVKLRAR